MDWANQQKGFPEFRESLLWLKGLTKLENISLEKLVSVSRDLKYPFGFDFDLNE